MDDRQHDPEHIGYTEHVHQWTVKSSKCEVEPGNALKTFPRRKSMEPWQAVQEQKVCRDTQPKEKCRVAIHAVKKLLQRRHLTVFCNRARHNIADAALIQIPRRRVVQRVFAAPKAIGCHCKHAQRAAQRVIQNPRRQKRSVPAIVLNDKRPDQKSSSRNGE